MFFFIYFKTIIFKDITYYIILYYEKRDILYLIIELESQYMSTRVSIPGSSA